MFSAALKKVTEGESLNADESAAAFSSLLDGSVGEADIAALLSAMHRRGETEDEVLGAVRSLHAKMTLFPGAEDAIDCCGTGGDNHGTFNVSTAAAFVLAGAGVKVAKHGNRAVSSKSGSSDLLGVLGVKIDATATTMKKALDETGVCFLLAPLYHPAMKHVAPVRAKLGHRTVFNLAGPLANPAKVTRQVVGVFSDTWRMAFARILSQLGSTDALVVHGDDGMDEITTTTATQIAALKGGKITAATFAPEDAGLPRATLESLKGGDATFNAQKLRELLAGATGPYRDIVLINAAAGLMVAGKAADWREGVALAAESIDTGAAMAALNGLIRITHDQHS